MVENIAHLTEPKTAQQKQYYRNGVKIMDILYNVGLIPLCDSTHKPNNYL